MYHVTRLTLKGVLLMSCSCLPVIAQASEKDELAQVIRQLDQVQASLERARALSAQSADDGRFYFDYVRASQDIVSMKQGISQYLDPSRAQPRDAAAVEGRYLAREGYESQMALAVISLANTVNHIAERDQHDNRDIVFTIDEAHVVTANPLVSPYFAKISKMWRKLGTWLWLATQNLKDYPDTAEKMLNMAEWWICLTMPPDEIEQIARFRSLTEEQKAMLASARKGEKKNGIPCYTEGVVLARNWNALFRSVPPSLYLALGMTEKDEKAQRRELMKTHQCSELEAVFMVARNLDERRGVSV